jgi:hypothetical protein
LAAAPAVAGGIANFFIQRKAGKENQRWYDNQNQMLDERILDARKMFGLDVNRDYMETEGAKGMLAEFRKSLEDQQKGITNTNVGRGATMEQRLAGRSSMADSLAGFMGKLRGMGDQWQQNVRNQYQAALTPLPNAQAQMQYNKAPQIAQSGANLMEGLGGLGMMLGGMGGMEGLAGLFGGGGQAAPALPQATQFGQAFNPMSFGMNNGYKQFGLPQ